MEPTICPSTSATRTCAWLSVTARRRSSALSVTPGLASAFCHRSRTAATSSERHFPKEKIAHRLPHQYKRPAEASTGELGDFNTCSLSSSRAGPRERAGSCQRGGSANHLAEPLFCRKNRIFKELGIRKTRFRQKLGDTPLENLPKLISIVMIRGSTVAAHY